MDRFESLGLKGGVWQGTIHREKAPGRVILTHLGEVVAEVEVTAAGQGQWHVSATIPADRLADGCQTFLLLEDNATGREQPQVNARRLASLPMIMGDVLSEDIQAELSLLRSELDLLKREFRRMASHLANSYQ